MPEGHSVHRIANQFRASFVGKPVEVTSPQGRFAAGAAKLDGATIVDAKAVGKQMFLEFDNGLFLTVHLGLYGSWDFAGDFSLDPTTRSAKGRMGQTNMRGTELVDSAGEDSWKSIGAPRRARMRMSESEKREDDIDVFPPEPIGAVRVRILAETVVADLRGPTKCDVATPEEVDATIAKLGPDPLVDSPKKGADRFYERVHKTKTMIGLLLMDQSVVAGVGNVYRAELLYRARLNPHTPGNEVPEETVRALWKDWTKLLKSGVELGQMMTMSHLSKKSYAAAMKSRDDRHWVYHREGLPCRTCGTNILMEEAAGRKLYWCPVCQA
ncbi:Fpg/Nei family DNA glycosylase [Frondihabitans australicus]|uniref:DNA-(apurinic or apyrimidinic site) lyase n=1 Tax=Frondihabitans australicus TaxID=386892 RepID=A0A495IGR9_9MICO|nr:DNA-formamidopyrimidine glycosylase family protein [Frondihabitans australicus]RKR74628.1 endonuclease-8/formamidopyrimidine-DNA glycosylase [Frondihabitans australicus]